MKLGPKITIITIVSILIAVGAGLLVQRSVIREQGIELTKNTMRTAIVEAENVRESIATLNRDNAFDMERLIAEYKESGDLRSSALYNTVPVVAAWKAIEEGAKKEGFDFRIPKRMARNPKNNPTPEEEKILDILETGDVEEYFTVDEERNEIVYARGIMLSSDCLTCHGDPKNSLTGDGKDIVGFEMENWKAGDIHGAFLLRSSMDRIDATTTKAMADTIMWVLPVAALIGVGVAFLVKLKVSKPLAETVELVESVASGDLTRTVEVKSKDEIGDTVGAFNKMVSRLRQVVDDVSSAADNVASGSEEMSSTAQQISEGASQQSASAEESSSSMEEMTASIQQNADNARQTDQIANLAADRVDAAESMRTHFLSHVRNELNNPVTSMLGLASRLSKVAPDEVERIQTISRLLHSEARVLSFHLENIFAVADLEAGAAEPTWARLDLEELIQDVSKQYKSRLNDKALELTVENKMSDTHVVSDASKLNMILVNLLANAVDFSRSGGEIHVLLENNEEDRSCTISVSDNGLGIPEKVQERIFDRFTQASSGFSKTHPGLGLGLTIVKGFAETLSGDVTVESKEGEGSCFKVRFVCPSDMEHLHDESEDGNEIFFGDEEVF